ncbi:hypothetical protein E4U42_001183 [Claviceps africana]|uniref:Uncharacterized protein n=1 Tax=Claviceps africana TaxID=83212 RepID=A0A8K0J029_9HYPO|nr:hypothetical protein E4U42_001183 [Claviceps africana]
MQPCSLLPLALAAFGVAKAQVASYTSGDGSIQTLVGAGYRCYEYSGQVDHVDAQAGVEAVFYK